MGWRRYANWLGGCRRGEVTAVAVGARPRRVAIIGNAGGGKSRLARQLGVALGLPVHEVDQAQWLPGWVPAPEAVMETRQAVWLAEPGWVIDGWGSFDLIKARFAAADLIIMIDMPFWRHCWWAAKRHAKAVLGLNPGWPPPGCPAWPVTKRLFKLMWQIHNNQRHDLLAMLAAYAGPAEVVFLRSPSEIGALALALGVAGGGVSARPLPGGEGARQIEEGAGCVD